MSGTYPTSPRPARLTIRSQAPTLQSVSHSLARQVRSRGAHRWGFDLEYGPWPWETVAPLLGFLAGQRGRYETFSFSLWREYGRGTPTGTPLVDGGTQTGQSVLTDGWTPSTLVIAAGDFLRFTGAAKVYQATADVTSNGSGVATIPINTPLVASPANDAPVLVHTAAVPLVWTCALADDGYQVNLTPGRRYQLSVSMMEAP
jgi:hypothetical protein